MSTVAENFRARGDMLIEGVHLLVDHGIGQVQFDEKKKTFLHNDINEIRDQYDRDMMAVKDFQTCQSYLDELLKRLISFLHAEMYLEKTEIFQILCQADRFATWKKGRREIDSETRIQQIRLKQKEKPVCQLSADQKREFLRILSGGFPEWYNNLSEWQKNYIKNTLVDVTEANIDQVILTIPACLRKVPGLANYSLHILELKETDGSLISDSQRFCAATPSSIGIKEKDERRRLTKQNIAQVLEGQLGYVGDRFLEKWKPMIEPGQILTVPVLIQTLLSPIWIDVFEPILYPGRNETKFLKDKEYAVSRIRDKLGSGRGIMEIRKGDMLYRIDPILISTNYPINFLRRETLLIKSKSSRNSENGAILLRCVSDFIGGIVLPKFGDQKGYYAQLFERLLRDTFQAIVRKDSLFLTISLSLPLLGSKLKRFRSNMNLCLNSLNLQYLKEKKPDEIAVLTAVLSQEQIRDLKLLLNAVKDYISLYNTLRKWIYHNKEMFLSCLEEIITEKTGGISCGSSLMGCNRKSMQTLHTDAMLVYQQRYGVLPIYNDIPTNRRRFVEIFVDLFFTEHQQRRVGQNAPGSEGVRELIVLPFAPGMNMISKDIVHEIKRRDKKAIKRNSRFAKLYKIDDPFSIKATLFKRVRGWALGLYRVFT